jgi:hypothetical protein
VKGLSTAPEAGIGISDERHENEQAAEQNSKFRSRRSGRHRLSKPPPSSTRPRLRVSLICPRPAAQASGCTRICAEGEIRQQSGRGVNGPSVIIARFRTRRDK